MASILAIGGQILGGVLAKKSAGKQAERIQAGQEQATGVLDPFASAGVGATGAISGALGLEGAPGQEQAFQNFLASTGFQSQLRAGQEAITGSAAARGLLSSGSTLKRLTTFGQGLAQQGFQNFLTNLGGLASRGLTAAGGQANIITGTTREAAAARERGAAGFQSGIGGAFESIPSNPLSIFSTAAPAPGG